MRLARAEDPLPAADDLEEFFKEDLVPPDPYDEYDEEDAFEICRSVFDSKVPGS